MSHHWQLQQSIDLETSRAQGHGRSGRHSVERQTLLLPRGRLHQRAVQSGLPSPRQAHGVAGVVPADISIRHTGSLPADDPS